MRTIVKIKEFGITRLNNAEYTNFSTRVLSLVNQAGTLEPEGGSALGIEEEVTEEYGTLGETMGDIVAQSRISDRTAELTAVDKQRDDLVVYLFKLLRSKKSSPLTEERKAATSLFENPISQSPMSFSPRLLSSCLAIFRCSSARNCLNLKNSGLSGRSYAATVSSQPEFCSINLLYRFFKPL